MEIMFLWIIHELRRFDETDRKEESLRSGWILKMYEEIGSGLAY